MARIFFSFSYADFNNASMVQSACKKNRITNSIFFNESIWNGARKKGDAATRDLIDRAVESSDLTVFLVGQNTYCHTWCLHALKKSITKKNGIFGIYLPNQMLQGRTEWLRDKGFPVYDWESNGLRSWIVAAINESLRKAS